MLEVRLKKSRAAFQLDVDFKMPAPGVVALFGPSGCGKSTLIRLIAGLLPADAGLVKLDSQTLLDSARGYALPPERRAIGCVFQDAYLFPHLSVRSNLRYGATRTSRRAVIGFEQVIEVLNLARILDRRPAHLSGGERQRVAIGRALLSQPHLLLLDEPLASLDAARRAELLPYFESLRDRLAIPMVFVTHRFDEVLRLATHVLLMREGRIVAQGGLEPMSLTPELRSMIGDELVGAVVTGELLEFDAPAGLSRLRIGDGELRIARPAEITGTAVRVQLLARDIIVATEPPLHLSVRNLLVGRIDAITAESASADLIYIDIGRRALILARITPAATRELHLSVGMKVWALVKSVSIQGHSFAAPRLGVSESAAATPAARDAGRA